MSRFRRSALYLTVATALLFGATSGIAAASTHPAKASKPVAGGTLNVVYSPTTLDPGTTATQQSSAPIFSLLYGQLYRDDAKGNLTPDLALGYSLSADGLTATIPLRHGVSFQDGTPFNAAAVAYNLNRDEHGDSLGTCPCATFLSAIKSVQAKGPFTVVIHLLHRNNLLQDFLAESDATYMVSPTALQKSISGPGGEGTFGNNPVGAGPYRLSAFSPGTSGTVTKFAKSYEAKTVYIQTITWQKITVDASQIAGCQSQTLQICSFGGAQLATDTAQISSSVPGTLYEQDSPRVYWTRIQFNVYNAPFSNPIAREAIQEATDPSQLLSITAGKPSVTCEMMASGNNWYNGSSCPAGIPTYNPAGAAALVASLPGGKLSFSVTSIDNTSIYSAEIPVLIKEWTAIPGITVTGTGIVPHSTEVAQQAAGTYQMIAPGPGGGFIDPILGAQPYIGAQSPQNAFGYKSAALDALLTRVETAKSPAQAKSLWQQYMALDLKNAGDLGLLQSTTQNYINTAVHNIGFSGFDVYFDHAWCTGGTCTH
jgi:peptide/nickel transport system substrate-binding protein